MLARDFLSTKLFPLKPTDTVRVAMEILNESNVAFLPVVEKGKHVAYISMSELMDIKPVSRKIGTLIAPAPLVRIQENQHLFEVIRVFANVPATVLSVVDGEEEFLGIISAKELIGQMARFSGFLEPGSIVTLTTGMQDYSLSEIARIVEYNNAKILSLQLEAKEEERQILVHLKLNTSDLKSLIATFERYSYQVIASYYNNEDDSGLKSRYDLLMRYLDL